MSPAAAAGPAIVPAPVFGPLVAPAPRKRSSNGRIRKAAPIKTVEDILAQQASTAQWIKEGEEKAREVGFQYPVFSSLIYYTSLVLPTESLYRC